MNALRIAMVQVDAGMDRDRNLEQLEQLLAGTEPVDLVALPEVFAGRGTDAGYRAAAEPLDGPLGQRVARLARERESWVLAGSMIEAGSDGVYNTAVLFNRQGDIAATYRKIHLFEAHLEDGTVIRERDAYDPGSSPTMVEVEGWCIGLAICFDLRFPDQFHDYAQAGAHLFLVPANFTQRTGKDHWEVLCRARAVENQCFVVAPNQCGVNQATGIASYGNSMVVGPWGEVLARAGDSPQVAVVELDPEELTRIRARIPIWEANSLDKRPGKNG